jgi:hypothetical protein
MPIEELIFRASLPSFTFADIRHELRPYIGTVNRDAELRQTLDRLFKEGKLTKDSTGVYHWNREVL